MKSKANLVNLIWPIYQDRSGWYHNDDHISYLLETSLDYFGGIDKFLFHSILFHDIVYNIPKPGEKNPISNEVLSAEFYRDYCLNSGDRFEHIVFEMIRATEHHFDGTRYGSDLINTMLDLDVHGFANPDFSEFLITQRKIDFEYISNGYDPRLVQQKRLEFLRDIFENKKLVYRILPDKEKLTKRAYNNIERLLENYNDSNVSEA